MTPRAVRDTCLRLAERADSRLERVALCVVALFAERDESCERIELAPAVAVERLEAVQQQSDSSMDRFLAEVRMMLHGAAPTASASVPKVEPGN